MTKFNRLRMLVCATRETFAAAVAKKKIVDVLKLRVTTAYIQSDVRLKEADINMVQYLMKRAKETDFMGHHFSNANLLVIHFLNTAGELPPSVIRYLGQQKHLIRVE
jgi:hypothetical protein